MADYRVEVAVSDLDGHVIFIYKSNVIPREDWVAKCEYIGEQ